MELTDQQTEAYSEPCQIFKLECFAKIVNGSGCASDKKIKKMQGRCFPCKAVSKKKKKTTRADNLSKQENKILEK